MSGINSERVWCGFAGKSAGFPQLPGAVAKQKLAGIAIDLSSPRGHSSSQEALWGNRFKNSDMRGSCFITIAITIVTVSCSSPSGK